MRDGEEAPKVKRKRRSSPRTFTLEARETFLTSLAATAHVTRSAQAAGFTVHSAYALRARDAAFAQDWRAALCIGYDRIESALMRKALGLEDHAPVADNAVPECGELDVELAKFLLTRHARTVAHTVTEQRKEAAFRTSRDAAEGTLLAKIRGYARAAGIDPPFSAASGGARAPGGADADGTEAS